MEKGGKIAKEAVRKEEVGGNQREEKQSFFN